MIAEYAGISMLAVRELDMWDWMLFRRDAFITQMSSTKAGMEYLENAWRLTQVKPEREKLRKKFGKGGHENGRQT